MDHFHNEADGSGSHWRMMTVLTLMMNLILAVGPRRSLNAWQYDFWSFLISWERTSKSMIEVIVDNLDLFEELGLWISWPSPTAPCNILPGWKSISQRRLLLLCPGLALRSKIWLLLLIILILSLSIIVEIIKHQVHIWIRLFSQMVYHLLLSIYRYPKTLLIVLDNNVSTIEVLTVRLNVIVKSPGLREVWWALRLVNHLLLRVYVLTLI